MAADKVKIAVIGAGLIGPRHARTVLASADATLVAIVDPLPKTGALAAEIGTKHYLSIADILASPDKPDAAIICTPNHTHVAVANELSSAGVHILIEKPLSTSVDSGKDLLAHLQETGVKVLVGHHRRFNPYMVSTLEAVTSRSLGDVIAVNGLWLAYKPMDYFNPPGEWRRAGAGGVILINLIHEVDLLHHLFGQVARVQTEKTISRRGFEAEEGAAIIFKFRSGVVGTFLVSDNVPSPHNFESGTGENPLIPPAGKDFYRIFGTRATLSVPDMARWSYDGREKQSWHEKLASQELAVDREDVPFVLQLAHFVKVVRGEEKPSCTAQAGLAALVVCDAVKRSLELGTAVELQPYDL
ncbi:hypothetical protein QBC46DRAFT_398451 [Diplogelasinospora grovesii]|uniref:Uncharacterized protein n=1 Tax=Diplogelasinospora grovesii TaxID=303347 RepID=A0AAN6MX00_9PEZI|nr:hypothetical protein QBC46DRAFT_398451 [Diplogelasinospora grovesii]